MSNDPPLKNSAQFTTVLLIKLCLIKYFQLKFLYKSDLRISTAGIHTQIIKIKFFKSRNKTCILPHYGSDEGPKGTIVNRELLYSMTGHLKLRLKFLYKCTTILVY